LQNFSVLRIVLIQKPALGGRTLPLTAILVTSRREHPARECIFQIQLLDLDKDGVSATIGIPGNQVTELGRYLGNSDVYLTFSPG
jgi:hypothetical protein